MSERSQRILIVDDRREMAEMLAEGLSDRGYDAVAQDSSAQALRILEEEPIDLLVTDLRMPVPDGMQLLAASKASAPDRPVIVMTAFGAIDSAIESIRKGASHYLTKPFKLEELVVFIERSLDESQLRRALKTTLRETFSLSGIVGRSPALRASLEMLTRVSSSDVSVLLLGETGTGKSIFARALHAAGARASGPFVSVNCAALPENLLESELFGHVRGSFTGATGDRRGLFEEADGGTIFLDEIGEMPVPLQAKLLHVLESGAIRPVGANRERKMNVRLIAATNRDLRELVKQGRFREDLLFRLDVISIEIPPLRKRREDIAELLMHFLGVAKKRHPGAVVESFSPQAMARLTGHAWPGNVRELEHLVERVTLLTQHPIVEVDDLPAAMSAPAPMLSTLMTGKVLRAEQVTQRYAAWALEQLGGHRGRTAAALDISPKTLSVWLDQKKS